jgi:hypothetical protein
MTKKNINEIKVKKSKKDFLIEDMIQNIGIESTIFIINARSNKTYKLHTYKGDLVYLYNTRKENSTQNKKSKQKRSKNIYNKTSKKKDLFTLESKKKIKPLYSPNEFYSILNSLETRSKEGSKKIFVN